jgi:hypothetical protein
MERSNEYGDLAVALAEVRPTPRTDFEAELDELVAAGFPRRSRFGRSPLPALRKRFRGLAPQRLLLTTGGAALAAIAIATVVVASGDTSPEPERSPSPLLSEETPQPAIQPEASNGDGQVDSSGIQSSDAPPRPSAEEDRGSSSAGYAGLPHIGAFTPMSRGLHRDIERSAEIDLLADPANVADDSAQVFSAVHDARGIVLRSTTTAGRDAGAHFDLLIPSARLGDALAAFSAIDEVRSRHEATADITKPTVATNEELQDSRARIDSLLAQLSTAEVESERDAIDAELRGERRHAARLSAQVARLHQRSDFSRVSLRIETDPSATSPGGGWGIDDALGNAGHILSIAGGVTLIGLAVIAPLALIGLLAWFAHRLWLRTRRERALDA